jgi:hypothetical protein
LTRTALALALVSAVSGGAGCRRRTPLVDVSPAAMEAHLRRRTEGRLIYVRAHAAAPAPGAAAALRIDEARRVPAVPPQLWPANDLGGQVDLLDDKGAVRWSMGYVPVPIGQTLIMRLPAIDAASSVRLTEPARHASAVAAIADMPPARVTEQGSGGPL